jgi:biotin carboxylase
MKAIVFIGTNKSGSSYDALKAAACLHYYTVLITNQRSVLTKRAEYPHAHLIIHCDIDKTDSVKNCIASLSRRNLDIKAIVSFIDPYCHTAAVLSREFGLKSFSAEAIAVMLNKIESRKAIAETPYVPFFYEINAEQTLDKEIIEKNLPLVLKAPTSAGSKDVYKVETYGQYEEALDDIRTRYPDLPILAEEYLDGPQYLIETVTTGGKVNIVAIIKQEITFTGRFIVTGYQMILDHECSFYRSLKETVCAVIAKHGIEDGPCHLEIRHVDNQWKLIEVNPRISGGAINSFIQTAYGINLVEETLRFALGFEPDFSQRFKKDAFLKYLILPKEGVLVKVTGRHRALNCAGVEQVYIRPKRGALIFPPFSMAYRYAYIIATGNSAEEARENAAYGASQIIFHLSAINRGIFHSLDNTEKKLIRLADKNKDNIEKVAHIFNNFCFM